MSRVSLRDLVLALGVVGLAGILAWQTTAISSSAIYAQVGPTVFPWIVTVMLGGLGLVLVAHALTGGWSHAEDPGDIDWPSLAWLAAALLANVVLIDFAGFILSSTVMFVFTARAFRSTKTVRDLLIGFALAFAAYVGFDRVLGYQIGSGLIEGLL